MLQFKSTVLTRTGNLCLLFAAIVLSSGIHSCGGQEREATSVENRLLQDQQPCSCLDNKPEGSSFTQNLNARNHHIEPQKAVKMIKAFEAVRSEMAVSGGFQENTLPAYETFNLAAIHKILCQPSAVGFRIYPGLDTDQKVYFILVGVDEDGKDVIQRLKNEAGFDYNNPDTVSIIIIEAGQRYP